MWRTINQYQYLYTRLDALFIEFNVIYSYSTKLKHLSRAITFIASARLCLTMNSSLVLPIILRAGDMAHWKVAKRTVQFPLIWSPFEGIQKSLRPNLFQDMQDRTVVNI